MVTGSLDNTARQVDSTADQLDGAAVHLDGTLSVQAAAKYFGVSEKTIRRRIKNSLLAAYQHPTSQGFEWRIRLDGAPRPMTIWTTARAGKLARHLSRWPVGR